MLALLFALTGFLELPYILILLCNNLNQIYANIMHTLVEKYTWFKGISHNSLSQFSPFSTLADMYFTSWLNWHCSVVWISRHCFTSGISLIFYLFTQSVVLVAILFSSKSKNQNWFTLWRTMCFAINIQNWVEKDLIWVNVIELTKLIPLKW